LREPNLGKTNPRVSLHYSLAICFAPSLADSFIFLTLIRLVVVFIFVNFSFALFTPPLGDFHQRKVLDGPLEGRTVRDRAWTVRPCLEPIFRAVRMVTTFVPDMSSSAYHNIVGTEKPHCC
jgi:hypothetical protein